MTQRWLMRLGQGVPSLTTWEAHAPFPTQLNDVSYAVRSDGTVIATGGRTPDGYSTDQAFMWQPTTQTWAPIAPMPESLHHHCLIPLSDGSVMCIGGQSHLKTGRLRHRRSVYSWAPSLNTWEQLPELHIGREQHSGLVLHDGRVMIIAGKPTSLTPTSTRQKNTHMAQIHINWGPFKIPKIDDLWNQNHDCWCRCTGTRKRSPLLGQQHDAPFPARRSQRRRTRRHVSSVFWQHCHLGLFERGMQHRHLEP